MRAKILVYNHCWHKLEKTKYSHFVYFSVCRKITLERTKCLSMKMCKIEKKEIKREQNERKENTFVKSEYFQLVFVFDYVVFYV